MLNVRVLTGNRPESDRVIKIKTDGWHLLTMHDIAQLLTTLDSTSHSEALDYFRQVFRQVESQRHIESLKESA